MTTLDSVASMGLTGLPGALHDGLEVQHVGPQHVNLERAEQQHVHVARGPINSEGCQVCLGLRLLKTACQGPSLSTEQSRRAQNTHSGPGAKAFGVDGDHAWLGARGDGEGVPRPPGDSWNVEEDVLQRARLHLLHN